VVDVDVDYLVDVYSDDNGNGTYDNPAGAGGDYGWRIPRTSNGSLELSFDPNQLPDHTPSTSDHRDRHADDAWADHRRKIPREPPHRRRRDGRGVRRREPPDRSACGDQGAPSGLSDRGTTQGADAAAAGASGAAAVDAAGSNRHAGHRCKRGTRAGRLGGARNTATSRPKIPNGPLTDQNEVCPSSQFVSVPCP
jgi:hypothetical protein